MLHSIIPQTHVDNVNFPASQRFLEETSPHRRIAGAPTEQLPRHCFHQYVIRDVSDVVVGSVGNGAVVTDVVGDGVEGLVGAEANDVGREILRSLDFAQFVVGDEVNVTCKRKKQGRESFLID